MSGSATHSRTPSHAILSGILTAAPIMAGYLPIAFSFGVAAVRSGLNVTEATFLSVVIYSGAAQFMALILLSGGTPIGVAAATLLALGLRHLLYAPTILKAAGESRSTRFAWLWSFGLTDEVFAAALSNLSKRLHTFSEWWMTGLGAAAYLTWVLGTFLGASLGSSHLEDWPALNAALGFLLPALFLSILLSIASMRQLPVMLIAGASCVSISQLLSPTLGVLAGMLGGAIAGLIHVRRPPRDAE